MKVQSFTIEVGRDKRPAGRSVVARLLRVARMNGDSIVRVQTGGYLVAHRIPGFGKSPERVLKYRVRPELAPLSGVDLQARRDSIPRGWDRV